MLDAILLERAGVPAIAIVTDVFRATGDAMAASWGLPGYRFLATPHPIANLTDKELDERADRLVAPLAELILGGAG
ncbi:MAG: hypothetical protein DMD91_01930 [Candidatus Rokuibacteriota bacterium]|nr:MAG: hypothetical protein DMD91_01930 [Candidatus Rokubacteria bacterium]